MSANRTCDLRDFKAIRVDSLSVPDDIDAKVRLLWVADNSGNPCGPFAFKPRFSYEREAVQYLKMTSLTGDWFESKASETNNSLEYLLDETLWQGRPVTGNITNYWLGLTPSSTVYNNLLKKCREQPSSPEMALGKSTRECEPDHNFQPAVAELLKFSRKNKPVSFGWTAPPTAVLGQDESKEKSVGVVLNPAVNLWFMPDSVLLVQWRIAIPVSLKTSTVSSNGITQLSDLLIDDLPQDSCYFGGLLSWLQSIRWLSQGFDAQRSEGKLIHHKQVMRELVASINNPDRQALPLSIGSVVLQEIDKHLEKGLDRRLFISANVALFSTDGNRSFNSALNRAFAHLLPVDTVWPEVNNCTDNYSYDAGFCEQWTTQRSYRRWADTGVLYGFSDYSAVSMGTSDFYKNVVLPQHTATIYSHITRLCLYQRTTLRHFGQQLSEDCSGNLSELSVLLRKLRKEFQLFNRHGWFQETSSELQPQELCRLQSERMRINEIYQGVRDELADATAYLDLLTAQEESSHQNRMDIIIGFLGLVVGVPTLILAWAENNEQGLLKPLFHMVKSVEGFVIIVLIIGIAGFIYRTPLSKLSDRIKTAFQKLIGRAKPK